MRGWFRRLRRAASARPSARRPVPRRLSVECLEDRRVPSANVLQTNLVSDLPGVAQIRDPNLVNPWGISASAGSPFWISDNNAGVSTLYNVPGTTPTQVSLNSLVVSIPTPGDPTGASGTPTGTVFNIDGGKNGGFVVTNGTQSGSSIFLFVTEDGTIVGWSPGVNPVGSDPTKAGTFGTIAKDNSGNNFTEPDPNKQTGAVYKGMAIATGPSGAIFSSDPASTTVIYVSNFRSGQIEVYDPGFTRVNLPSGAFSDPNLPSGYAPFDVQVLNGLVYVTYAKQDATRHDDAAGSDRGFVDVFNLNGTPAGPNGGARLASRGVLDSPWGLAIAPAGFAGLSAPHGDPVLLVGNFGDGRINAFDATTGQFLGGLKDPDGEPIQIDGLWALRVGNGGQGGATNTVYFTAGLFGETHGLFGALTTAAPGSPEGQAEAQAVIAALDVFQLDVATLQQDLASGADRATIRQDLQNVNTALADVVRAEVRFALDARNDLGTGHHHNDGGDGGDQW
ncbi:MAG TPA: TIGR03118 family protein [Gemmataceae bacterium]|nr:TIGR03118 family protein [Gemmataceae bacterium]